MLRVKARLNIEVLVDCPHCDNLIDLLNSADTNGFDHNDGGDVLYQAVPDGHWMDEHKKFSVDQVQCSECLMEFNVKGLDW